MHDECDTYDGRAREDEGEEEGTLGFPPTYGKPLFAGSLGFGGESPPKLIDGHAHA